MTLTSESSWDDYYEFYSRVYELIETYDTEKRFSLYLIWGTDGPQLDVCHRSDRTVALSLMPGANSAFVGTALVYERSVLNNVDEALDGEISRLLQERKRQYTAKVNSRWFPRSVAS